ncbi:hypothetical protein [Sphingomonas sp. LHG3406-1]|uniref:hypothetical protein n=1 Tax=Sphingomonas sp. LHG3406-1 TaxID=2804617 RepID=UPI002633FF18|nr:hypothetical protein [Sphingomonas sp. LHG3406-1]
MSAPLRFLGVAVLAYVGLRTASSALALQPIPSLNQHSAAPPPGDVAAAASMLPPGIPADMGPLAAAHYGAAPYDAMPYGYAMAGAYPPQAYAMPYAAMSGMMSGPREARPFYYPVPYPAPTAPAAPAAAVAAVNAEGASAGGTLAAYEGAVPPIDQWPAIGTAGPYSLGDIQRTPSWGKDAPDDGALEAARPRRLSVDAWALLRPPREGVYVNNDPGRGLNPGLASAGALGGSQAGMRISWRPIESLGVHLRASTALLPQGRSGQAMAGGEGALGVSWKPLRQVPVRIVAERRQRLGPDSVVAATPSPSLPRAESMISHCPSGFGSTAMRKVAWWE